MKESREQKRNRKRYFKASFDNDFHMSNGGHGIEPYPTFEEWMELGGHIMPSWRERLKELREAVEVRPEDKTPVGDLVSDIALELAAEEHRQGLRYGKIWDHCERCTDEVRRQEFEEEQAALRRRQARCRHRNTDEFVMHSFGGEHVRIDEVCQDCGMSRSRAVTKVLG